MAKDLSERGVLTQDFLEVNSIRNIQFEPILLSNDDNILRVHEEDSGLTRFDDLASGDIGHVVEYTPQEFFEKYGDVSQMVTVEEYRREAASISGMRDDCMHHAADLYNQAVEYGYASDPIEYSGTRNYGRIETELNYKLRENKDVPDVVKDQINELRGRSNDLKYLGSAMDLRLRDIDGDVEQPAPEVIAPQ